MRQMIGRIRARQDLKTVDMIRVVFNAILAHECKTLGSMLIRGSDGRPYYYDGLSQKLYYLNPNDRDFASVFLERYTLIRTEDLTRHVVASMEGFALRQGNVRELRRFSHFDPVEGVLYLSRYDGTCWRLDGASITTVPNGAGALFIDDDKGVACDAPQIGPNGVLLPYLVDDLNFVTQTTSGVTPQEQRTLLALWTYAIAFPELLPTKPLLLLEGTRGSGKTSTIQRIQLAVHGRQQTLSVGIHDEQDFGVMILRSPLALLDNIDRMVDWLQDALGAYTMGGTWARRKKYTDDEQIEIRPSSFLSISTRNPVTFRRDDMADRCLILRLDRRITNTPLSQMLATVTNTRQLIYGEWLFGLNRIVAALRQGTRPTTSSYRLADFATLAHVIGPAIGISKTRVDFALRGAQSERDVLTTEGDPLIDLIDRWLSATKNQERWVSASDLHGELALLAKMHNVTFHMQARLLSTKLREGAAAMARFFAVETLKTPRGVQEFKFVRT